MKRSNLGGIGRHSNVNSMLCDGIEYHIKSIKIIVKRPAHVQHCPGRTMIGSLSNTNLRCSMSPFTCFIWTIPNDLRSMHQSTDIKPLHSSSRSSDK